MHQPSPEPSHSTRPRRGRAEALALTSNTSASLSGRFDMMMDSLNSPWALGRLAVMPFIETRAFRPCSWWNLRSLPAGGGGGQRSLSAGGGRGRSLPAGGRGGTIL